MKGAARVIRRVFLSAALACFVLGYLIWARDNQQRIDEDLKPVAVGSVEWVLKTYGCADPADKIPAHVIVDKGDGKGWRFSADVQSAFEQLTHDGYLKANEWTPPVDHHIRVARFCA